MNGSKAPAMDDHTLFVSIVRYLREQGWSSMFAFRNRDRTRQLDLDGGVLRLRALGPHRVIGDTLLIARPVSVQQGADLLVAFGILPPAFASWEWKPTTVAHICGEVAYRIERRADEASGGLMRDYLGHRQYDAIQAEVVALREAAGIARDYAAAEGR